GALVTRSVEGHELPRAPRGTASPYHLECALHRGRLLGLLRVPRKDFCPNAEADHDFAEGQRPRAEAGLSQSDRSLQHVPEGVDGGGTLPGIAVRALPGVAVY